MARVLAAALVAIAILIGTAACGSIVYVNDVTRKAGTSVDAAQAAEADKYAPYYWTRAKEYLQKARERAAYADYQGANRFGRLAAEAAQLAEQEAAVAKKDPSKRPIDVGAPVAPAKSDVDSETPIAPAKDKP